jgi:hypothetical protein
MHETEHLSTEMEQKRNAPISVGGIQCASPYRYFAVMRFTKSKAATFGSTARVRRLRGAFLALRFIARFVVLGITATVMPKLVRGNL